MRRPQLWTYCALRVTTRAVFIPPFIDKDIPYSIQRFKDKPESPVSFRL